MTLQPLPTSSADSHIAVTTTLHRTFEAVQQYREAWNALVTRNATNELFLTWEWQTTWWDAYQPGELFIVVGTASDHDSDQPGQLIGIAAWFIERDTRMMRSVGCVDVTDYIDIVVTDAHRATFLQAAVDLLVEHRAEFGKLDLCNIPQASPTLTVLPELLKTRGFTVQTYQQEVCPIVTLPTDFESYLNQLDKKQRHEARRKLRRTEDQTAEQVTMKVLRSGDDVTEALETFLRLMASSHPDKALFLQNPQHVAFFRAIMPQIHACGWLQLAFLMVNDEPAAAYLNFDYDNRILVYNSGLVPEKYAFLSPGIVLTLKNIAYAIEQGRKEFDFLRGNEEYKYRMGGVDRPVMSIEAE